VEAGTRFFWLLIAALLGAAAYFGLNAESRRRAVQTSQATLESGAVVQLQRVVDGDTLLVDAAGQTVVVRLLGIKAFPTLPERDPVARFGKAAADDLRRLTENQPLRVLLHEPPKDRHGRTLAELFVGRATSDSSWSTRPGAGLHGLSFFFDAALPGAPKRRRAPIAAASGQTSRSRDGRIS
jgi:hypothetical protein